MSLQDAGVAFLKDKVDAHKKFHGPNFDDVVFVDVLKLMRTLTAYKFLVWLAKYAGHHLNACAEVSRPESIRLTKITNAKW